MAKNRLLIISSVLVLPFNLFIFGTASANFGARSGFFIGCIFYWIYVSLFVLLLNKDDFLYVGKTVSSNAGCRYPRQFKTAAFLPAAGAFLVALFPNIKNLTLKTGLIILVVSIVNGTVEEIYWRGLYLRRYKENLYAVLIVSPVLFALMHFSFLAIKGMTYEGGAFALVGGALLMGLLWSYVSFKLNTIRHCIAGHIVVNICAFTGLFVENGLQLF
ncbi:MAG TPA: CPBP family intramembrane glutamic endopeptidase [Pyrinomonadaceae bacterium]|nr:CPBP family intramembrane glutamic endopeptidase [Pyrinomonadaceae bacterium]